MILKRMLWIAVLVAMTVIVGCGGKQATDEPPPVDPAPTTQPAEVEEVSAPADPVPSSQLDPSMISDVYFDFDSYALSSEAKGTLEANARQIKNVPGPTLTIEGHCDERGTKAYNLALGEKRANAARDYLVAMGVDGSRLNTVSYGKERPFDQGHDESAWAKNRRAHFVVQQ